MQYGDMKRVVKRKSKTKVSRAIFLKSLTKTQLFLIFGIFVLLLSLLWPKLASLNIFSKKMTEDVARPKGKEELAIPKVDSNWKLPEKNRLYTIRCTSFEIKPDDICYVTISELKKPESERILSRFEFKESETNDSVRMKIIGIYENNLIVHIQQNKASNTILVDVNTGTQEQVKDVSFQPRKSIYFDSMSGKFIYTKDVKNSEFQRVAIYNLNNKTESVMLDSQSVEVMYEIVGRVSSDSYLFAKHSGMSLGYEICTLNQYNQCVLTQVESDASNNQRTSSIVLSSQGQYATILNYSKEYNPRSSELRYLQLSQNPTSNLIDRVTNEYAVKPINPKSDYPYNSPYKSLTEPIFSPTGKSVIYAYVSDYSYEPNYEGESKQYQVRGKIIDDQGISAQEVNFINKLNDPTVHQPEFLWQNLANATWISFVNDDGNLEQSFIFGRNALRRVGISNIKSALVLINDPYRFQYIPLNLAVPYVGFWDAVGPNGAVNFLFDPVLEGKVVFPANYIDL